jgi:hypothetical protein
MLESKSIHVQILDQITDVLDMDLVGYEDIVHSGNHRNYLWKIEVTSGEKFILKSYSSTKRWENEKFFYSYYVNAYGDYAPIMIGNFSTEKQHFILISLTDGKHLKDINLPDSTIRDIFFQAGLIGQALRSYYKGNYFGILSERGCFLNEQEMKIYIDSTDPIDYINQRARKLFSYCKEKSILNNSEKRIIYSLIDKIDIFCDEKPVLVNLDFTPKNWMIGKSNNIVGVIDFEKIEWGVSAIGVTKLASLYRSYVPGAFEAFLEGYYGEVTKLNRNQIEIINGIDALRYRIKGYWYGSKKYLHQSKKFFKHLGRKGDS